MTPVDDEDELLTDMIVPPKSKRSLMPIERMLEDDDDDS